jgi:hypothetical protein
MAEVIEPFESRKGRPPKYPWTADDANALGSEEHWTDGKSRRLRRGRDFDADLISFRTMVHRKAREMSSPTAEGPKVGAYTHINKSDQSIEVRFYDRG